MWEKWHWPNPVSGKCMVCLAGAIIAKSLNCSTKTRIVIAANRSANPKVTTITNPRWRRALLALDFARDGKWASAFRTLQEAYPNPDMRKQLQALPKPDDAEFESWKQLHAHLRSLSTCASELRRIDL